MLRITPVNEGTRRATLKVEGTISAEFIAFLQAECCRLLRTGAKVDLDLAGVDYVDRKGVAALRWLRRAGVEVRCASAAVAGVLEAAGVRVAKAPADDTNGDGRSGYRSLLECSAHASGKGGGAVAE